MLFIHISDIHFKQVEVGQPDDPNLALRNDMIRDVKAMRQRIERPADGVLLSGDIAYAGKAVEYDFAYRWLENELCPAAGCTMDSVFIVPGNHDVDRSVEVGPAFIAARKQLREIGAKEADGEIRRWFRDRISAGVIFGPIENYNRFAARFLCSLRSYIETKKRSQVEDMPGRPFATRDLSLDDGSKLRLWGFNTVLISDANDKEGRMLIDPAASQIQVEDGVTHLVMCHHPFGWLKNRQAFEDRVNAVAKIQLFGHEHTRRVDENKRYLRIRAGALQPDRDDTEWKPGYNWIDVSIEKGEKRLLRVRLWVRMHEVSQFQAIHDPDDKEIWENRFELPAWTPPAAPAETGTEAVQILERPMTTEGAQPVTVRSVTIKLFKLREHEQRRVISRLQLDRSGDRDLKDYELAINAVRRSQEDGKLGQLNDLVDKILAGQGEA
ncbi:MULTISPECIES: metallophosphoesterase [Mesorhizobium]|uniref:metallophosphoesterase n=1 Tax=Mesorhizobium TaxID=68287 RepID=UPI0010A9726B|nr:MULTISPECIES: metallophosphoesterase [Mesorhizobium]